MPDYGTSAAALAVAEELAQITETAGWPALDPDDLVLGTSTLLTMYQTDKAAHGYLPAYQRIAARIGPSARVCEVGVFCGGSLAMWQAMIPGGVIAGVDNNPACNWPAGTARILADQDDEALPGRLIAVSPDGFDLIVDDASHDGLLTRRTWELLWPLVRPGGYYVIEDWFVGLGGHPWETWGDGMLRTAESFLPLLNDHDSDPDSVEYRYGMILMHRRAA